MGIRERLVEKIPSYTDEDVANSLAAAGQIAEERHSAGGDAQKAKLDKLAAAVGANGVVRAGDIEIQHFPDIEESFQVPIEASKSTPQAVEVKKLD